MQTNIFFILILVSALGFIIGVLAPQAFSWLCGSYATRPILGGLFLVSGLVFFFLLGSTATPSTTSVPATAPAVTEKVAYEVVKQWDTPDAGAGKLIVISEKDANMASLKILGSQLEAEYAKSTGNVLVIVYTSKTSAELRDTFVVSKKGEEGGTLDVVNAYRVGLFSTIDEGAEISPPKYAPKSPEKAYDKSFVGLYRKGEIYGKHQWVMQPQGLWDTHKIVTNY